MYYIVFLCILLVFVVIRGYNDNMEKQELQKLNNFVIFKTDEGKVNIDVFFAEDTLWLTQKIMAELFGTTKQNVSLHLQNIFREKELEERF